MPFCIALCLTFALLLPALADTSPTTVNVWPGLAPGERTSDTGRIQDQSGGVTRVTDVTCPQLHLYRLDDRQRHPTVVVFPGGGYGILATDLEGSEIAQWLNTQGFNAAVLYYRVPNNRDGALQDAQRAVSLLRARAREFGIDSKHLGVLGFSAGGHLAARLACNFKERAYTPIDNVDRQSCRPDFAVLVYPAYLIDKTKGLPPAEVQPHPGMPPLFLTQTRDDPYFDAQAYADVLEKAGVTATSMVYDSGGHGYGLRLPSVKDAHLWPQAAAAWLAEHAK